MRIALVPLDSRPPNRVFPQRLAKLAGCTLITPPRELMGDLHRGGDSATLARWLRDAVNGRDGSAGCQAAVFSWDALLYGGLIQSRQLDATPQLPDIESILREIDWAQVAGYCFATVPRLGISVTQSEDWQHHELVREYFIAWGAREERPQAANRASELHEQLGPRSVDALWRWRQRNLDFDRRVLELSYELGIRHCHVAVEDNAPTGPHLQEVESLRQSYLRAKHDWPVASCSFFDGADEAGCLLTARAICDARAEGALPVQLTVAPRTPGPVRYTGLYESHTLGDGLAFLGKLLKLAFTSAEEERHWYVIHGLQPQPDVFVSPAGKVFSNPLLIPKQFPQDGRLFLSDLCACNGGNTTLIQHLARNSRAILQAAVAYNTNFNTLGLTAAWLRLSRLQPNSADRRFLLERLADDYAYQSVARSEVTQYLLGQRLDPLDFAAAHPLQVRECLGVVRNRWLDWCEGAGGAVLRMAGIDPLLARSVQFAFPWDRVFEIEATVPW